MRSAASPASLLSGALLTPCASPPRRHLGTDYPGILPPNLATATVSASNLGGLCGLSCKTDQLNYNAATGACAYTDTSKPKCDREAAHEMYFQGLGTTQSGSQVGLRVTNLTEYTPWDSNQNGLSDVWGQISMLANHPSEFLFEFFDIVCTPATIPCAQCSLLPPKCPHPLPAQYPSTPSVPPSRSARHCPLSAHLPSTRFATPPCPHAPWQLPPLACQSTPDQPAPICLLCRSPGSQLRLMSSVCGVLYLAPTPAPALPPPHPHPHF